MNLQRSVRLLVTTGARVTISTRSSPDGHRQREARLAELLRPRFCQRASAPQSEQRSNRSDNRRPIAYEHAIGDPQHAVAGELQMPVSGTVALEGGAGPVIGEAVNLDDQLSVSPEGIDLEAGNDDVDRRWGKLSLATEIEKAALEFRAGFSNRPVVLGEQRAKRLQTAPAGAAFAKPLDRDDVEHPRAVDLRKHPLELTQTDHLG
jgi:hypothetical protein